jgi:hypothetical protein
MKRRNHRNVLLRPLIIPQTLPVELLWIECGLPADQEAPPLHAPRAGGEHPAELFLVQAAPAARLLGQQVTPQKWPSVHCILVRRASFISMDFEGMEDCGRAWMGGGTLTHAGPNALSDTRRRSVQRAREVAMTADGRLLTDRGRTPDLKVSPS